MVRGILRHLHLHLTLYALNADQWYFQHHSFYRLKTLLVLQQMARMNSTGSAMFHASHSALLEKNTHFMATVTWTLTMVDGYSYRGELQQEMLTLVEHWRNMKLGSVTSMVSSGMAYETFTASHHEMTWNFVLMLWPRVGFMSLPHLIHSKLAELEKNTD